VIQAEHHGGANRPRAAAAAASSLWIQRQGQGEERADHRTRSRPQNRPASPAGTTDRLGTRIRRDARTSGGRTQRLEMELPRASAAHQAGGHPRGGGGKSLGQHALPR